MAVKRRVLWVEVAILMIISLIALREGLRLVFYRDPHTLYDILGPGVYRGVLSLGLMITSLAYFWGHLRGPLVSVEGGINRLMRFRLVGSFAVLTIYIILISIVGYLLASFIFFVLEFRIIGIKSWLGNLILSAFLTAAYYLIFEKYCHMVFPRGFLFNCTLALFQAHKCSR